jgi:hypothetical protein
MRYDTRYLRTGLFTSGRAAHTGGRWTINNAGWNSPIDYSENASTPLIAIIGDSYVEAFSVDSDKNFPSVLRKLIGDHYRVYSFGISGASLAQYLQMSRYVREHFKPKILVFNIIHNDFDESLTQFQSSPYFLRISGQKGNFYEVPPQPYTSHKWKRFFKSSAAARYIYENLSVWKRFSHLDEGPELKSYVANVNATSVNRNKTMIEEATFFLVRKIRTENPGVPIVFMMDALREQIYSGTNQESPLQWMHVLMKNAAETNDCYFFDLTQTFRNHYQKNHQSFNADYDWHWNELGHDLAGKELYQQLKTSEIIH